MQSENKPNILKRGETNDASMMITDKQIIMSSASGFMDYFFAFQCFTNMISEHEQYYLISLETLSDCPFVCLTTILSMFVGNI